MRHKPKPGSKWIRESLHSTYNITAHEIFFTHSVITKEKSFWVEYTAINDKGEVFKNGSCLLDIWTKLNKLDET